jgi:hypothetical protein
MTEYWVSKDNFWCKLCKCWMKDNVVTKNTHEGGARHKEALREHLKGVWGKGREEKNEKRELEDELRAIEEAALKTFEIDMKKTGATHYREMARDQLSNSSMLQQQRGRRRPPQGEGGGGGGGGGGDEAGAAAATGEDVPEWKRAATAAAAALNIQFYYVDTAGVRQGPHPLNAMQEWHNAGQLPATTMVAVAGGTKWMQIARCAAIVAPMTEAAANELEDAGSQEAEKARQAAFLQGKLGEMGVEAPAAARPTVGTSSNSTPLGNGKWAAGEGVAGEVNEEEREICGKCKKSVARAHFSKSQLKKEPEERQCSPCVQAGRPKDAKAAGGDDGDGVDSAEEGEDGEVKGSV